MSAVRINPIGIQCKCIQLISNAIGRYKLVGLVLVHMIRNQLYAAVGLVIQSEERNKETSVEYRLQR